MTTPSRFVFPPAEESEAFDSTFTTKKGWPQIHIHTDTKPGGGYTLTVPQRIDSKPASQTIISTPPDSPTRIRLATMGSQDPLVRHDSAVFTPPATPTGASHTKSNSASSGFLTSLASLRRGDSTSSRNSRPSLDSSVLPGSTELLIFPHHLVDYDFITDEEGKKRPIGVGAWSEVYLAKPGLVKPIDRAAVVIHATSAITPPVTPIYRRESSNKSTSFPMVPDLYAVKVPGSTSAKKVLTAEARILSYLSRFPDAEDHIVSFHGQDTRTGALVLKAMVGTLEDWMRQNLNILDEVSRAQKLVTIFPAIALSLINNLIWMQDKNCIHADIKPSNVLVSLSSSDIPQTVFSDFSSTILTTLDDVDTTPPPMGAGTWDFLDPSCISSFNPAAPSAATDLWSLAITLLFLALGRSPFEAFKNNKFQMREMIKSGSPLQCLAYDDQGIINVRRLKMLSKDLGFDVMKWFAKVLVKNKERRVNIAQWREELISATAQHTAHM